MKGKPLSASAIRLIERGRLSAQKALDRVRAEGGSEFTTQLLGKEIEAADELLKL